jgi:hypothetical protein
VLQLVQKLTVARRLAVVVAVAAVAAFAMAYHSVVELEERLYAERHA